MVVDNEAIPSMKFSRPTRPGSRLKLRDIIIFGILAIICVILVVTIIGKLNLKQEVAQAKIVSDKVISAMAKQNTSAIRTFGDSKFQAKNSAAALDSALTFRPVGATPITFAELYGDTKPTVDRQIVANNSTGQHVAIVYRYAKLKVPFYVRVDTTKAPGKQIWHLQALSAGPDETKLISGSQ
jgi:hypothetical protein